MDFFSEKKGQTSMLREIAWLVIAVVVISFMFLFTEKLWAAFTSEKDDGSMANLDRLYNDMKQLIQIQRDSYRLDEFFIGSGKILVAFDTDWDGQQKAVSGKILNFNVYKPFKCGNSACICLYTSDWNPSSPAERDKGVIECRSDIFAGRDVAFVSEGGDVSPKTSGTERSDGKGNYLMFYGYDKKILQPRYIWKVQSIYIEKFYSGGKIYFYVSSIDKSNENNLANIRRKGIDSAQKASS